MIVLISKLLKYVGHEFLQSFHSRILAIQAEQVVWCLAGRNTAVCEQMLESSGALHGEVHF